MTKIGGLPRTVRTSLPGAERGATHNEPTKDTERSNAWNPLIALDDPYPIYRRLRDAAPVHHDKGSDLWALSRFDDVQAAAKDWETFSTSAGGRGNDIDDTFELFLPAGDLAGVDPPLHTRLRGALRMAFSPSALR